MASWAGNKLSSIGEIPLDGHAVIEANAGTGKTNAIAHLYVELLLEVDSPERILVLSFTEKATLELKGRIEKLIQQAKQDYLSSSRQIEKLAQALRRFNLAPIYTIHTFCYHIVDEFLIKASPGGQLQIIDRAQAFHAAFRAALREEFASKKEFLPLLREWLKSHSVEKLEQLLSLAHYHRYLDTETSTFHSRALAKLRNLHTIDEIIREIAQARLKDEIKANAISATNELYKLLVNHESGFANSVNILASFDFTPILRLKTEGKPGSRVFNNFSPATREFIFTIQEVAQALKLETRIIERFLPVVVERLEREKRRRGLIDYDDMLGWTWRLLNGPAQQQILDDLRSRFTFCLVDEFQDTDELQWRILRRIFVEGQNTNRLYVIGDPKQAIYSFRHADVYTYLSARDELKRIGACMIHLDQNFRSTASMVQAVNVIFSQDAKHPIFDGQIRYDHPSRPAGTQFDAIHPDGESVKPVTIACLQPSDGRKASAREIRNAFAAYTAEVIRRLLNDPRQTFSTKSSQADAPEPLRPQDVLILTRTNHEIEFLVPYLRKAGIPFVLHKQGGLFQSEAAEHILTVLRAIDRPRDRSARLKAYLTPFFGKALERLGRLEENEPELTECLIEWKAIAESGRLGDLFRKLLERLKFNGWNPPRTDADFRIAPYEKIIRILLERAYSRRYTLSEIIRELESYISRANASPDTDLDLPSDGTSSEAVQLMTVHKSKGLQAKVVILFGGFYRAPRRDLIVRYHIAGKAILAVGPEAQELAKEYIQREEDDENSRLLYVAATRARVKLYLPFVPSDAAKKQLNGYYTRLNARLSELITSGEALKEIFCIEEVPIPKTTGERPDGNVVQHREPPNAGGYWEEVESGVGGFKPLRISLHSYSSLQRRELSRQTILDLIAYIRSHEATKHAGSLRSGIDIGSFVHRAIEVLDWSCVREAKDFTQWRSDPRTRENLRKLTALTQIDQTDVEEAIEMIYRSLRAPIRLGDKGISGGIATLSNIKECEFWFPRPSDINQPSDHQEYNNVEPTVYFIGSIDVIFEHEGLIYFADWKTDTLASYTSRHLEEHVASNYRLQLIIYLVAILRFLRIKNVQEYDSRFGGIAYLFVRGLGSQARSDDTEGVYFYQPSWDEVVRYQKELCQLN